jgi:hypothetical protein
MKITILTKLGLNIFLSNLLSFDKTNTRSKGWQLVRLALPFFIKKKFNHDLTASQINSSTYLFKQYVKLNYGRITRDQSQNPTKVLSPSK